VSFYCAENKMLSRPPELRGAIHLLARGVL
jgi:hypothetical protein